MKKAIRFFLSSQQWQKFPGKEYSYQRTNLEVKGCLLGLTKAREIVLHR